MVESFQLGFGEARQSSRTVFHTRTKAARRHPTGWLLRTGRGGRQAPTTWSAYYERTWDLASRAADLARRARSGERGPAFGESPAAWQVSAPRPRRPQRGNEARDEASRQKH